ncbi:MAG: fumarate hydratase [Euryarchaeota archaeon]|nr:fumarate hydratase [Euryarchaeota archaeon]MBV1729590.1 fumarate hydratase [Methanobacterium sp.]MBU4547841.1 fumarate hydratase [Euryarchaeota archaeon]MBU4608552.1 fumarate hydratase [Euryarchaeota archaeon]MBV1755707.1 fumarate hydratase [Methanobacterium sp.]
MITQKEIEETIFELFKEAVIKLPDDVKKALKQAYHDETTEMGKLNLKAILDNIKAAEEMKIPMCQDTGLPIIFVKLGNVSVENLYEGIRNGVRKATSKIPLRPNVVHPFTRENTRDNIGENIPQVDVEIVDGDYLEFTVFPKGFGSENNNALKMALPGEGVEGVKKFVVNTVIVAQGKPCPPVIVGVGIGGSSDLAMKMAKKALLGKVGNRHPDKKIASLEQEILKEINDSGIGPMGLGGNTTALDVKIKTAHTHTAGLPIGICIQCWAGRHATKRLRA